MNILISSNSNGGDSTNVLQHRQISSTTRPNTIMRTPDHYEMIDQIGKGEKIFLIASSGTILIVSWGGWEMDSQVVLWDFHGFLDTRDHVKNLCFFLFRRDQWTLLTETVINFQ